MFSGTLFFRNFLRGGLTNLKISFDQFSRHFRQFWTTLIFFHFWQIFFLRPQIIFFFLGGGVPPNLFLPFFIWLYIFGSAHKISDPYERTNEQTNEQTNFKKCRRPDGRKKCSFMYIDGYMYFSWWIACFGKCGKGCFVWISMSLKCDELHQKANTKSLHDLSLCKPIIKEWQVQMLTDDWFVKNMQIIITINYTGKKRVCSWILCQTTLVGILRNWMNQRLIFHQRKCNFQGLDFFKSQMG